MKHGRRYPRSVLGLRRHPLRLVRSGHSLTLDSVENAPGRAQQ